MIDAQMLDFNDGDTLILTFGEDADIECINSTIKIWKAFFPHSKIIGNREDMITDIKIIKNKDYYDGSIY